MTIHTPDGQTLADLRNLSPAEFEQTVTRVYAARGWDTERTQSSRDAGRDIVATSGTTKLVIQAKRYSAGNKVGQPAVQQYAGLLQEEDIDTVAVVTTSEFTDSAKVFAQGKDIRLVNGEEFLTMLHDANESLSSTEPTSVTTEQRTERPTTLHSGHMLAVLTTCILYPVGIIIVFRFPQTEALQIVGGLLFVIGMIGIPVTIAADVIQLRRSNADYQPSLWWAVGAFYTGGIIGYWFLIRRGFRTDLGPVLL